MKALAMPAPSTGATNGPREPCGVGRAWLELPDNGCSEPLALKAELQRVPVEQTHGWVSFDAKEPGGDYRLNAELTIPFVDFAGFGVAPEGGFDDERVVLGIPKLGFSVAMTFDRIEPRGVVYVAGDTGVGLCIEPGDSITVEVNGNEAATGVF